MDVRITDDCIGSGACETACPEVFRVGDDGYAHVRDGAKSSEHVDAIWDAHDSCPSGAVVVEEQPPV